MDKENSCRIRRLCYFIPRNSTDLIMDYLMFSFSKTDIIGEFFLFVYRSRMVLFISWRSILFAKYTGVSCKNHQISTITPREQEQTSNIWRWKTRIPQVDVDVCPTIMRPRHRGLSQPFNRLVQRTKYANNIWEQTKNNIKC